MRKEIAYPVRNNRLPIVVTNYDADPRDWVFYIEQHDGDRITDSVECDYRNIPALIGALQELQKEIGERDG